MKHAVKEGLLPPGYAFRCDNQKKTIMTSSLVLCVSSLISLCLKDFGLCPPVMEDVVWVSQDPKTSLQSPGGKRWC